MAKTMFTRLGEIVAENRAKKAKPLKEYRVSRIDESFCFVKASSEKEALELSNETDAGWHTWIGETVAEIKNE